MVDRKKITCTNPNHPFKQKWYWYRSGQDSPLYCSSCYTYLNFIKTFLAVALQPQPTLYGDSIIKTDREQIIGLIDEVLGNGR